MSTATISLNSTRSEILDTVLERGLKLRNSIVTTILKNNVGNENSLKNIQTESLKQHKHSLKTFERDVDFKILNFYLRGYTMNKNDETKALDLLRTMTSEDLCHIISEIFNSCHPNAPCLTCLKYQTEDLTCDIKRSQTKIFEKKKDDVLTTINETILIDNINDHFKHIDSLKICVHELFLNDRGLKKVGDSLSFNKKPSISNQIFFIEYHLPFVLNPSARKKSSVDSGLNSNSIKICSKRLTPGVICFEKTSMHTVQNIDKLNLSSLNIKFNISCRIFRQQNSISIGYALFEIVEIQKSPTLTCIKEIPVRINENSPIIIGTLNVTIQMGYGKLYFGKEFLGAIQNPNVDKGNFPVSNKKEVKESLTHNKKSIDTNIIKKDIFPVSNTTNTKTSSTLNVSLVDLKETSKNDLLTNTDENIPIKSSESPPVLEKQILFGFLYIAEANFIRTPVNCYFTCKPFCQDEVSTSKLILHDTHPVFNFSQVVPLIYEEKLILGFRENVMVIEFWEKFGPKNVLFGVSNLSLNQFYVSYRNKEITRYLSNKQFPIISSDWWEAIYNPYTEEIVGQVQILLALGTDLQITNLEVDRGFKKNAVRASTFLPLKNHYIPPKTSVPEKKNFIYKGRTAPPNIKEKIIFKGTKLPQLKGDKEIQTKKEIKIDKGIQSDFPKMEENKNSPNSDKLEEFLNKLVLMQEKAKVCDSSTNTVNIEKLPSNESKEIQTCMDTTIQTNNQLDNMEAIFKVPKTPKVNTNAKSNLGDQLNIRSTSELLTTLQNALSVPSADKSYVQDNQKHSETIKYPLKGSFKAKVEIINALHLPLRKKTKLKRKTLNKNDEQLLPSCYVTFETIPGTLKMTHLVQKSVNPVWNYNVEVLLPSELLFNNNKKLIFKVWRKSTNTNMIPNLQSDVVLGYALLDLTVLLSGLPNIKGYFNINDLSGKCFGQIFIHVLPLEDLNDFIKNKKAHETSISPPLVNEIQCTADLQNNFTTDSIQDADDSYSNDGDLLSRALKRKFTELEEITERLRCRLSDVTKEESDETDEFADDFEKDINSVSYEEDDIANLNEIGVDLYETNKTQLKQYKNNDPSPLIDELDLSQLSPCGSSIENQKSSMIDISSICSGNQKNPLEIKHPKASYISLDQQLIEGKQKIDALLGKLSLISSDQNNSARYVSGCSTASDTRYVQEQFLTDLKQDNCIYGKNSDSSKSSSSDSDVCLARAAPDGEGNADHSKSAKIIKK